MFIRRGRVFVHNQHTGHEELAEDRYARLNQGNTLDLTKVRGGKHILTIPVGAAAVSAAIALVRRQVPPSDPARCSLLHYLYASDKAYAAEYRANEACFRKNAALPPYYSRALLLLLLLLLIGGMGVAVILTYQSPAALPPVIDNTTTTTTTATTTTTMTTTTTSPPTTAPTCVPSDLVYVSYDDEFGGPGITYTAPFLLSPGFNSSLGLMNPATGDITFIGKMRVDFPLCNADTCYGTTIRSLYMGPDQQLYGTAWELAASLQPTFLIKIDKNNAAPQIVCQFLPFFLYYQTIGIGIDSNGLMYWKRPGTNDVRILDLTTCAISSFSLDFNATAATLYFDKLYFIDPTGRMLRIDPPDPTVVDTGYDTGIIYGVPEATIVGNSSLCFGNDMCWAPTTLFPYVDAAYETSMRAAYGTVDVSRELFYTLYPENATAPLLFLNRSITNTSQIVYGAAPTCYHNVSVNIPPIVSKRELSLSMSPGNNVLYMAASMPNGGEDSLLVTYNRRTNTALPLGRRQQTNIARLFVSPSGNQLYGVDSMYRSLYVGTDLQTQCTMTNVSAVYGFSSDGNTIIVQTTDGNIRPMNPQTCVVSTGTPLATFACGPVGALFNDDLLYCVDDTHITVVNLASAGAPTVLQAHGLSSVATTSTTLFKACRTDGSAMMTLFHNHQFLDVSTSTGALSNTIPFTLGVSTYPWYPAASVWCS